MQKMKNYQKQNKDAAMVAEQQCNIMKTGIFKVTYLIMIPQFPLLLIPLLKMKMKVKKDKI